MTTTNKQYFVELQPCGPFFFGSERTFNTAEKDKYNEEVTNYFAESNKYPQQTAILGLLRHTMLALNNCLDKPNDKHKIIGDNFDGIHEKDFGFISTISPLVIIKKHKGTIIDTFIPAPFTKQKKAELKYSEIDSKMFDIAGKERTPVLDSFDYKEFKTELHWQNQSGNIDPDIFYELTKVGVKKNQKDDAFYKQTFYGLNKNYSFGVWVTFSDNADVSKLKDIKMPFGADQGIFKITFHENISTIFSDDTSSTQSICLTSDAFVDHEFFNYIDYAISDYTDFRFIKSKTDKYYQIKNSDKNGNSDKSGKMRLIKRGSVFYGKNINDAAKHLKSKTAYRNIGYNFYKFI